MSWRRLRTLIRREILATFRDPFTVGIFVAVPLVALMVFGFVLSTEVKHLDLGVLDGDGSTSSRRVLADLEAGDSFDLVPLATRAEVDQALTAGRIKAAIVIPPGFGRRLGDFHPGDPAPEIQVAYDGTETVMAGNVEAFLRALVRESVQRMRAASDTAASRPVPDRDAALPGPKQLQVATRALFNPKLDGTPFMVSGVFGFVLSFLTVILTAVSIVNERITGTFEQLQVTPATSLEIFLGKILPLGAIFAFDVVLMVLAAGFFLGVWPAGSVVFFVLVSSFYVLFSLALGLLISATSHTAAEAVQKTVMLSIPLVQLSGFLFPVRSMPLVVRWLTELFPATHYIRVSRAIYLRGEGPLATAPDLLLLFVFAALVIRVSLRSIESRQ